jgi:hypothetical protein
MVLSMTHENDQISTPENEAPKRSVVTGDRLAISGDHGRAVSGAWGRAIAGDHGCAISDDDGYSRTGREGYSLSGNRGLSISGDNGMSIAGVDGIVRAGRGGMIVLSNADEQGIRFVVAADISEDAVPLPDTYYRLDGHAFVEAFDVDEDSLDITG